MKNLLIVGLSLLSLISMSLQAQKEIQTLPVEQAKPIGETKHISNDKLNFTLDIPKTWEIVEQNLGVDLVGLAPLSGPEDLFRENFNVLSVKLNFPLTEDEYFKYNLNSLHQLLTDFDLEDEQEVTIDGVKAKKIVFTHTMGIVNAKVIQYLMLANGKAYVLTFTAARQDFDKVLPEFNQIAQSFKFKPQSQSEKTKPDQ